MLGYGFRGLIEVVEVEWLGFGLHGDVPVVKVARLSGLPSLVG
jgi:hypothetical protein